MDCLENATFRTYHYDFNKSVMPILGQRDKYIYDELRDFHHHQH